MQADGFGTSRPFPLRFLPSLLALPRLLCLIVCPPVFRFFSFFLRQIRYSDLVRGLKDQNVQLNRRMLAELAVNEPYSFKALVDQVKFMRGSA